MEFRDSHIVSRSAIDFLFHRADIERSNVPSNWEITIQLVANSAIWGSRLIAETEVPIKPSDTEGSSSGSPTVPFI